MSPQTPYADLRLMLTSLRGTRLLAGILAEAVRRENPGALLLYGDLGAGKTTFTAALVKALPGGVVCVSLERCVPGYGGQRLLRPAESDDAASNLLQDHKRPAYPHEGRRGNRSLF